MRPVPSISSLVASFSFAILVVALSASLVRSEPPEGGVEGPHRNIPGFPENSCSVCHDIVPGTTGRDAIYRPNETCLGCHTDGPTFGEGDPNHQDRPHATPVGNHASLVTGTDRFIYGDLEVDFVDDRYEQQIHCTTCHDPHRTFDPLDPMPSTQNVMYIRDHTDNWIVLANGAPFLLPTKEILVTDLTGAVPVDVLKEVDQDIVYTTRGQFADDQGLLDLETDVCQVCHTLTNHHQVDGTAPGGQSHFDGENCTACHTHVDGFGPTGGGQPITGPHAVFGDPDCGACHDLLNFPGGPENPEGLARIFCAGCHDPATDAGIHSHLVSGTDRFEYALECLACHDQHGWEIANIEGSDNIKYVKARITEDIEVIDLTSGGTTVNKTIDHDIVFTSVADFADGDGTYTEDICNTCHTLTNHHQNDGDAPGGQSHFDGQECTACHSHPGGFGGATEGPHPQAVTDCSNCHVNEAGDADLVALHGGDCFSCHESGFGPTFLGPVGSWSGECADCHNSGIAQTGYADEPTNGHRCVVCHGVQRSTTNMQNVHWRHTDDANCVVCHGFIPDMGVEIGSGNRDLCGLCHTNANDDIRSIHETHTEEGLNCFECHGGERPPIDVEFGDPIGNSTRVCEICHSSESGSQREIHEVHTRMRLDCGSCHIDANLQDDRIPMPPLDDERRDRVDRTSDNECGLCHGNHSGGGQSMHRRHATNQWQWCFNCHEGNDDRPTGGSGPIQEPAEACDLCHSNWQYTDEQPFDIHYAHAPEAKCYTCHQVRPELVDWPPEWLGAEPAGLPDEMPAVQDVREMGLVVEPNPFRGATVLNLALPRDGSASLFLYDVEGRVVETLFERKFWSAGVHPIPFVTGQPNGVYFLHLTSEGETLTEKIVLSR